MTDKILVRPELFKQTNETYYLVAGQCKSCGQAYFPRPTICLNCHNKEVNEILLGSKGKLFTYTTVMMPSSGFDPPYSVGYVDFPEGIRLFSQLDNVEDRPFQIGMDMELYIGRLWEKDGKISLGYRCRPM